MQVNISSLRKLQSIVEDWQPDCIVSAIPTPKTILDINHLQIPIEDIYNAQIISYKTAIREVLAQNDSRILVHCEHGKSRSAALAIAKLYQDNPESVSEFLDEHPEAEPNPLLLLFADEILEANGDLLKRCSDRYKGRQL